MKVRMENRPMKLSMKRLKGVSFLYVTIFHRGTLQKISQSYSGLIISWKLVSPAH